MADCQKCGKPLYDCTVKHTNAFGKMTCNKCQNTSLICPTHNGLWKKG